MTENNQGEIGGQSLPGRIRSVVLAPAMAMEDAAKRPMLMAIGIVLVIVSMLIFIPQRPMFLQMTMKAVQQSAQTYTAEEAEALVHGGANAAMFMSMFYLVCTPFFKGGVAYALSTILGGSGKFKETLGVVLNAYLIMLIGQIVRAVIVLAFKNPYFSFSAAMLLGEGSESSSWFSVLSAIDLFALWYLAVSMVGIRRVQGLSALKAFIAVFGPWLMVIGLGLAGAM